MNRVYGIYGAGGFGREIMPVARRMLEADGDGAFELVFVDDTVGLTSVNGVPVLRFEEFAARLATSRYFNVSVANGLARRRLAERCLAVGALPFTISSADRICYEPNEIGEGAVLCAYTTITANARIGKFFHANIYSYVAHDCVVGDYVTFAPSVACNGNVTIEDYAYVGTGAVIRNGERGTPIVIGEGAVIGMGAVVTKSVPPGVTVVGNPAIQPGRIGP